jgi:hypothetical protein
MHLIDESSRGGAWHHVPPCPLRHDNAHRFEHLHVRSASRWEHLRESNESAWVRYGRDGDAACLVNLERFGTVRAAVCLKVLRRTESALHKRMRNGRQATNVLGHIDAAHADRHIRRRRRTSRSYGLHHNDTEPVAD